jgi:SET domain-containing protein
VPEPWKSSTASGSTAARLAAAAAAEATTVAFGKSGVHGWGLHSVTHIPADALVCEYRGALVRHGALAAAREAAYRAAGADCYLFSMDATHVVDGTAAGSVARFTNHACAPCLYTRVVPGPGGRPAIAFFARVDIPPGTELTYDYRFAEEEGDAKVACACGAAACRGSLN